MKRPHHRVVICVRRDHVLQRSWRLSYCIKSDRMSSMLVSGKNVSITKKVVSDDIDDIQDLR